MNGAADVRHGHIHLIRRELLIPRARSVFRFFIKVYRVPGCGSILVIDHLGPAPHYAELDEMARTTGRRAMRHGGGGGARMHFGRAT